MTTRKEIRKWFVDTFAVDQAVLGVTYPSRTTYFNDDSPSKYTSVYITDMRYGDEISNPTSEATLYVRFHLKLGTDDDLDGMEARADQLIDSSLATVRPPFSLSKEGVAYEESSDGTYDELSIEYSVLYRE